MCIRKKRSVIFILLLSAVFIFSGTFTASAATKTNLSSELTTSKFPIYQETMDKLEQAAILKPELVNYFNKNIKFFEKIKINADEFNSLLCDVADSTKMIAENQNTELEKANNKAKRMESKRKDLQQTRGIDPKDLAYTAYMAGITKVKERGCAQTASYMEHAAEVVAYNMTPDQAHVTHSFGDFWAQRCAYNEYFTDEVFMKFEEKILATGKSEGVVSGTFAFTTKNSTLDQFAALHKVKYTASFSKASSGNGYNTLINISDVYDFAWGNYEQIAIGFGNNYCKLMQELGLIKPFAIDIYADA